MFHQVYKKWLLSVFAFVAFTSAAQAAPELSCVGGDQEVTLTGVATEKATYVSPSDFGWAPENGFVSYPVVVVSSPVCFRAEGETVKGVFVVQLVGPALDGDMQSGIPVTVKGKLFLPETAHHFEKILVLATSVSRR